jgi:dihydrodipicolinate synthase/N-acetylneuraminate lyase
MKANNQFIKGQSGNPQGRPKGSGLSAQLRAAIEQDAPSIIKAMIEQAKAGDIQAAKTLLDRVLPALKPESQAIHLPELVAAPTLADKAKAAIDAAGAGDIAPSAASDMVSAIAGLAKIIETTELQKRLEALELLLTPKKDEK